MSSILIYWLALGVIDGLAIVFNSFLIYLALYRTPKMVRTYTTLIINMAVTDCCSAFLNLFVQQRIVPFQWTIGYVSYGVCSWFGADVCYASFNLMAHFIVHSNYSLLLSFAYRYYILKRTEPRRRTVMAVLLVAYVPSFIQLILYQLAKSPPSDVLLLMQSCHPEYDFTGLTISGISDIRSIFALWKILQMTIVIVPIFSVILLLRKKIIDRLIYRGINISMSTKSLHSQLLMALTYQALLPVLYSVSVVMYALEQSGVYSSVFMENYILSALVLIPLLSPFTSFFFFTPYKRFIMSMIRKKPTNGIPTISEIYPGSFPV